MPISVRVKFAGFLRGLLGRVEGRGPDRPAAAAPLRSPASLPPVPPAPATPPMPRPADADEIELPLAAVVAGLPLDLRAKLVAAPPAGQNLRLPSEMVISQLAFGMVKISFGELRHLAPGIFVNSGGELDHKLVSLPLQEILPRVNPALLARRAIKKVEVAEEISGPFAERGRGLAFTTQPLKAPNPPLPAPTPAPSRAPEPPATVPPPVGFRNLAPPPITTALPANGATDFAPSHPLPTPPPSPRSVTPAANGSAGSSGHTPANGHGHERPLPPGLRLGPWNGESQAAASAPLKMQAAPAPPAASSAPPATPRPAQAPPTIFVTLGDLCDHWPDDLKNEILRSPLSQANVPLDGGSILPGLKRGRVVMSWKQLRQLAQPSSSPSPNDPLELELPLNVIAPLFLAAQKIPQRPRPKAAVSSDIPDLFFGFPQAVPAPAPAMSAPPPKPPDTNFYIWGETGEAPLVDEGATQRRPAAQTDFTNRLAHPKDVVAQAARLPGVAGSVVALQDGLRVASQVPAELNADTLAAFLPQIFERVNQCTRELRMGALNNVNFTVGNVPWKIFRVNAVYFAAFGRAGEPLPSAPLAQLAASLDRKQQ